MCISKSLAPTPTSIPSGQEVIAKPQVKDAASQVLPLSITKGCVWGGGEGILKADFYSVKVEGFR